MALVNMFKNQSTFNGAARLFSSMPAAEQAMAYPVVTMVKKIKADGSPCRKCDEVTARLSKDKVNEKIHRIVYADEKDANSEGAQLARQYDISKAPFFIVNMPDGSVKTYQIYFQLKKEILAPAKWEGFGKSETKSVDESFVQIREEIVEELAASQSKKMHM